VQAVASGLLALLADGVVPTQSLPAIAFFHEVNSFLDDEIAEFAGNLLGRVAAVAGAATLGLLTCWIMLQGYRIITGRSREPMMLLVVGALRAVLVIGIATGAAAGAGSLYRTMTDDVASVVAEVVSGEEGEGPYEDIDRALGILQVALLVIEEVQTGGDPTNEARKERAMWFTGVGVAGPALMAGCMLLMNKIAMALVVGLGPIFILCLLFDATRQLFSRWLFFGLGTLFSLALLTVMVTLALDMVVAVGTAFWVASLLPGGDEESLTSMAMQQGGMGLVLTMLIVSAPPMAAMFFSGVLGQFGGYNAFAALGGGRNTASPPGSGLPPGVVMAGAPGTPAGAGHALAVGHATPAGAVPGTHYGAGPAAGYATSYASVPAHDGTSIRATAAQPDAVKPARPSG
jgi:type IV secretion system protein VirB6